MVAVPPAPADVTGAPRWGMGDAVAGWMLAIASAAVFGALILAAFGYTGSEVTIENLPLSMIALQYPPLWLGFVGVPVWAAARKGGGWVHDFRVHIRAIDVPVATLAGIATQLIVVPLVSLPMLWLLDQTADDLGRPARELSDKATSAGGVALFLLIVVIGAPIAEELFFRGLVLRSIEKRFGTAWGVAGSSVVFGATHFQLLQLPALTAAGLVFALLVVRTGRLGAAIVGHMAFNAVTAVTLVWLTS